MRETDASRALKEARDLVRQHDYAEALAKYIWFHEHALEHDPAMVGVRLSYAIMEWAELGEVYPPARVELEAVRDAKTRTLEEGSEEFRLFLDVQSINKVLGQEERTCELFAHIAERDRDFAQKCFPAALESLVDTRNYSLARRFLTSTDKELSRLAAPLKSQIGRPQSKDPRFGLTFQEVLLSIYAKRVKQLLQILVGVGEEGEARRVHQAAIECFEDAEIRDQVTALLSPSPPSKLVQ